MGVDLNITIRHRLSKAEILDLPATIESWDDVKSFVKIFRREHQHLRNYSNELKTTAWETKVDEELLEKVWEYRECRGSKQFPIDISTNSMLSYFGWFYIQRHTLTFEFWPEHKYDNLHNPIIAAYIFHVSRMVAKKFGTDRLLYYPDSAFMTSMVAEEVRAGVEFDGLIEYATKEFGTIPEDLNTGMRNMLFIDKIENEIGELNEWDWTMVSRQ